MPKIVMVYTPTFRHSITLPNGEDGFRFEFITTGTVMETSEAQGYAIAKEYLTFGDALEAAMQGAKITREGWNGKGMWIMFVPGSPHKMPGEGTPYAKHLPKEPFCINGHFDMKTADGSMLVGWTPSTLDMLGRDWKILLSNIV